jgi:hypothetical protein
MSIIPQWIVTAMQQRLVRLRARDLDSECKCWPRPGHARRVPFDGRNEMAGHAKRAAIPAS